MKRLLPHLDIVRDILEAVLTVLPGSAFIISLNKQYTERGSLSKKQLQGLYQAAKKSRAVSQARLVTLEAIIMRMPTRSKSALPGTSPLYQKDESTGLILDQLLARYPRHKQVLFLKQKYDNNEMLTPSELTDLKRIHRILLPGK